MEKEIKSERITIRCTPSQKKKLENESAKFNMHPTTYAGDKLFSGKLRMSYAKRKVCTSLVTVGNYLDELSSLLDNEPSDYISKELVSKSLENAKKEIATIWKY